MHPYQKTRDSKRFLDGMDYPTGLLAIAIASLAGKRVAKCEISARTSPTRSVVGPIP